MTLKAPESLGTGKPTGYRKKTGPDAYYGKVTITKSQTVKWSKHVTKSNSYYLYVYGNGTIYKSHTLKGTIKN